MTEMRWNRVESIFHEALSLHGEQRARFLAEACQGDEWIRSEVDSLLASHHESDAFLEEGALPQSARTSAPTFNTGVLLGHYEIIQLLGTGGMGEVYLARDQRLGRKVALKILPAGFAGSIERLRREAQAASALNHPNILTIYDFGQQSELHYIVSEFVDGVQLREKIGSLSIAGALNYARQIGQALEAAHSVGIVHRDIKPENIMVRPDGYIKVLDFGLAKLVTPQSESGRSLYQRLVGSGADSIPGMLIGTLNYMSPEQVRGQPADLRTDIWSWGVVLYEMLSGRRPFEASTPGDVLAAILNRELLPPSNHQELNRVVARALSKRAEERYPNMHEALEDLPGVGSPSSSKRLKRTLLAALVLSFLLVLAYWIWRPRPQATVKVAALTTLGNIAKVAISPDGNYVAYATMEKGGQALRIRQKDIPSDRVRVAAEPVNYIGITFSRDGQYIYYVVKQNERGKLYRIPVMGGDPKPLIEEVDSAISFSPDGSQFVFWRAFANDNHAVLYLRNTKADAWPSEENETPLETLRAPRYFLAAPRWSPDGSSILYGTGTASTSEPGIELISRRLSDGKVEKVHTTWSWIGDPVWLRNGHSIALAATGVDLSGNEQILEISWPDGRISSLTHDDLYRDLDATADSRWIVAIRVQPQTSISVIENNMDRTINLQGRFRGLTWTTSGKLISEIDLRGSPDLWSVDVTSGDLRQITEDRFIERDPVASRDGKYLVYASNRDKAFHLWQSNQDGSHAHLLTSGSSLDTEPAITPGGEVIYTSIAEGGEKLWRIPIEGGTAIRLTDKPARKADISPDGNWIVCQYSLTGSGWSTVILNRATGAVWRTFPKIREDTRVHWSHDSKDLLYVVTDGNGVSNVWAQAIDGGPPRQLTHFTEKAIFALAPSPNGSSLACIRGKQNRDAFLIEARWP